MRVLHWFPNYLAGGGVANSVSALAAAQARAGAEVSIASLAADHPIYGPLDHGANVRVHTWRAARELRGAGMRLDLMNRSTRRTLAAQQSDVVHLHGEFNPDNWWVPRLWAQPLVLTPHGAYHPTVLRRRPLAKRGYIALAKRLLYARIDLFHALNPGEQRDIDTALPAARTVCIAQGPSPAVQDAIQSGAGSEPPRPARDPAEPIRLMFIGRLDVRTKGLDLLVEAFAEALGRAGRAATLTLVGPDWAGGAATVRALADRLGVGALVHLPGTASQTEVASLLQSCDVYVQLSRNEGSPLSLNDALVLGKPVIASDQVGTMSSPQIAGLEHVMVVAPRRPQATEALVAALENIEELERHARSSRRELAGLLSWEHAARRHLEQYESLLDERRRA